MGESGRGMYVYIFIFLPAQAPERKSWESGVDALEHALKMESDVTKSIRTVISACEGDSEFNDYHVSFQLFVRLCIYLISTVQI
jgi:ferritin